MKGIGLVEHVFILLLCLGVVVFIGQYAGLFIVSQLSMGQVDLGLALSGVRRSHFVLLVPI